MTVAIQVNDVIAVKAWMTLNEQAAVNTYNYECITLSGGAVTDDDFLAAIQTAYAAFYKSLSATTVTYNGLQAYYVRRSGPYPNPVQNVASAGPCTFSATVLPRVAAGILKYNTTIRGPGGRGRVFLPFIGADYAGTDGKPTAAYDVLVNSFASNLLTPVVVTAGGSTATMVWGIFSRLPTATPAFSQIVQAQSADKFGNLHKRGDYGRANASPI